VPIIIAGGGAGSSGSLEYDYVEQTSQLTVTATSEATAQSFIDGNSVSYDGSTRVKIEFACGSVTVATGVGVPILVDGSTSLGWLMQLQVSDGGIYAARFLVPSAGAHTYHIKAWKTAGTFVLATAAGGVGVQLPAWYRITKA
jgi:hypothetical protein